MAYQASGAKTPDDLRRELCELYLRRHDRINDWDLVDLGASDVVGRYVFDQSREVLDDLARSKNWWERRTAVLATLYFIRRNDLDDSFRLAGSWWTTSTNSSKRLSEACSGRPAREIGHG
ncbi:MAG TPA: DNA alkylation repair protein [Jiangellaceae bacterium]|nr:DNA alkylation repair protein [Jiangellaceae bacterium]